VKRQKAEMKSGRNAHFWRRTVLVRGKRPRRSLALACTHATSNNSKAYIRNGVLILILSIPSLYLLLSLPPLWRDSDGFNEIASTFAPKGIIHWLPVYCLGGRLIVFGGSILGSLLSGHGIPYLSISITPLNDAGVYTLIIAQHIFLIFALFCAATTFTDRYPMRVVMAICFALTPWLYIFANCIGSEAFSNPLVILIAAHGFRSLTTPALTRRNALILFGLLLTAALTRQINGILAALLPMALLPFAVVELFRCRWSNPSSDDQPQLRNGKKLLVCVVAGVSAIGASIVVQQTMCWIFRVPYRSTFGETFEWRLSYLEKLSDQQRTAIVEAVSAQVGDPVVTEALEALNQSLSEGNQWANMFLFYKIDAILLRSGFNEMQHRTWQIDLRLNRIARTVLLSGDPYFLKAVWKDFTRWPYFTQSDLAYPPFILTDWLQTQLPIARYTRLRGLASFQHPPGFYDNSWKQVGYFRLFAGIPILAMAGIGAGVSGVVFLAGRRRPEIRLGVAYVFSLIVTGVLISFGNCMSTFLGARFYLPVYSVFQLAMLLGISLAWSAGGRFRGKTGNF
jgi:hypothetical protein